jgi:uncharacterized protein YjbK
VADKGGREVELKLRVEDLSALMSIAIAAGGKPEPTARQENTFFDTPERALGADGLVLRLRAESVRKTTRWFITGKGPGMRAGSLTSVREEEIEIDAGQSRTITNGEAALALLERDATPSRKALVQAVRSAAGGDELVRIGSFVNERTRLPVTLSDAGVTFSAVLELDRTTFPGNQIHHEVEMEIPEGVDHDVAQRAFDALFARAGVSGRVSAGKARRFFAALRGEPIP